MSVGLGVFDGFHMGHREIVSKTDAILTLFPHPDRVLGKNAGMGYLSSPTELAALVPHLLIARFSSNVSQMSSDDFLRWVKTVLAPSRLVVGSDFRFGRYQAGSIDTLRDWGEREGISIEVQPLVNRDGVPIKSSQIREQIIAGDIESACQSLGHPYPMFGRVMQGKGMGKTLGFPTANLRVFRNKCVPPFGVYAATVHVDGGVRSAILYIGNRATLGYGFSIEIHIPGYSGELYGTRLHGYIHRRIRGDMKFGSVEALVDQIKQDIDALDLWRYD
jgi:riboflavin kinase/FMN adenylyltransferase